MHGTKGARPRMRGTPTLAVRSAKAAGLAVAALLLETAWSRPALAAAETAEPSVFQRWIGTTIVGAFILGIIVAAIVTLWRNRRERRNQRPS